MDSYQENIKSDHNLAATTSVSIGLAELTGIGLAYLSRFFGRYFEGVQLPFEKDWAENAVVDGMINGLIGGINATIRVTVPLCEDFFRFFFTETMAWALIALSLVGFIFAIVGLKSEIKKQALSGMAICITVMVFAWLMISRTIT
jgi:hypothetical protein